MVPGARYMLPGARDICCQVLDAMCCQELHDWTLCWQVLSICWLGARYVARC